MSAANFGPDRDVLLDLMIASRHEQEKIMNRRAYVIASMCVQGSKPTDDYLANFKTASERAQHYGDIATDLILGRVRTK